MAAPIPLVHARSNFSDLYDWALTSAYRAGHRVYPPDLALSKDPDIFERVRRDPVVGHAIEQRLAMVAGDEWAVMPGGEEPADKTLAHVTQDAMRQIMRFTESLYELASADITGRAFGYISTRRRHLKLGGLPAADWIVPTFIDDIDYRRMRLAPEFEAEDCKAETMHVGWELFSVTRRAWESIDHPEWFIRYIAQDDESRLGYGRGLIEAIYMYHFIKTTVIREGLQGLERWAQGTALAKIDGLREASDDRSNDAVRTAWVDAITGMKARHSLVFDKLDDVEFINGGMEGHQMVMDWLRYLDDAMVRLLLGSVLPTGGGNQVGSLARAQVEETSRELLIKRSRRVQDEVITRDLVGLFLRLNRATIRKVGLGDAARPSFARVQERWEDPTQAAQIVATARAAQIPLRKNEVYRKLGYSVPAAGDDVFEPLPTPPSGLGVGPI